MANVLVVDDDSDIARLIEIQLRRHGHNIAVATSGEDALGLVEAEGRPDVAVLDDRMPGTTGSELLAKLRSLDGLADLPAIFLTGLQAADVPEVVRDPNCAYLTKAFTSDGLLDAVVRLMPFA